MISSCSRWMVATMSRMAPVRAPSRAARRAPGPPSSSSPSPPSSEAWSSQPRLPSPSPASVAGADGARRAVDPARRRSARPRRPRCAGPGRPGGAAGPGPWGRGPWPGRRARPPGPASRPPGARGPRPRSRAGRCGSSRSPAPGAVAVVAPVDPAEAQRLLPDVELVEAGEARADDDVALLAELVRPPAALVDHGPDELLGVGPQLVEALVGPVHMGLFRLELRMRCHSRSLSTPVRSEPSIISSGHGLSAGPRRRCRWSPRCRDGSAAELEDRASSASGSVARVPVADSAFLRACRCQPVDRVPVWFMRQAGRSLPEYRAARGEGSILDAIRQPELAAELTLQPVRRYGVDAAILFSDIVVPAAAVGFGVEVEQGRGPVVDRPFRRRRGPGPAPASRARGRHRLRARGRPPRHRRARPPRDPAHRLRRRPVHGGQLPGRRGPVARLRPHQGPHAGRSRPVRPAARRPGRHGAGVAARPGGGRAPPRCSSSTAGWGPSRPPTTSATSCPPRRKVFAGLADLGRAAHPLRRGHRRAAGPDGAARGRGRRGGLAGAARRGPATRRHRAAPCRATSTPPPVWRRGTWSRPRPATCSSAAAGPGTCSTSATACCPRPTPTSWPASWSSCTRRVPGATSRRPREAP